MTGGRPPQTQCVMQFKVMTPTDQTQAARLIVVSGPSGVGKSTIVDEVIERTGWMRSVSATTRQPRAGEVDGRQYHFVSRDEFEKMIAGGELLEWAQVFGELYGTPAGPVREARADEKIIILEIDVQGGKQVYDAIPGATFVLILPPDDEQLRSRLCGRGSEDSRAVEKRLGKAKEEIRLAVESGAYKYRVTNDNLDDAVTKIVEIIKQESSNV